MSIRTSSVLLLMALMLCQACNDSDQEELLLAERGRQLHLRGQSFYCELQALGKKSQDLWNTVAEDLERVIPHDLPEDERNNMIAIRNAGLIRMFEAYPALPQEVKDRVDVAEEDDKTLAGQMRMVNDSLRKYELEVEEFLNEVRKGPSDSVESWQKRLIIADCP